MAASRTWRAMAAAAAAGLGSAASGPVLGDWQVVVLHPPGAVASDAYAAAGGLQGGSVESNSGTRPVLWHGSSAYTDLLPDGLVFGEVLDMSGSHQAGYVRVGGVSHAAMWSGSVASFMDLHPAGASYSRVHAIAGAQQVGEAGPPGTRHAALWRGTAQSWVDLHPAGADWSEALATDGTLQGGRVDISAAGVGIHAGLWAGTAESFVDLNPAGAVESRVNDMATGVQVGFARWAGQNPRAALWRGSPESFVDLSPAGAVFSSITGTNGTLHVGAANFAGGGFSSRAVLWWDNTPGSYENLHEALGPGWVRSAAQDVLVDDGWIYVVGSAVPEGSGRSQAVLWRRPIPAPGAAVALGAGLLAFKSRRRRWAPPAR